MEKKCLFLIEGGVQIPALSNGVYPLFPLEKRAERWRWSKMEEERKLTEEEFVLQGDKEIEERAIPGHPQCLQWL